MKMKRDFTLIILYIISLGIIFFIDIHIPLGVAAGVPYILPVLITMWTERKIDTYIVGGLGVLLTIVGYFASPCAGGIEWMIIFNRALAIFVISLNIAFVISRKNSEEKIKSLNRELNHIAHTDQLTQTGNRLLFVKTITQELEKVKRYDTPLSIILFDIDYFKKINDTYGHDIGDIVLKSLCEVVSKNIRKTDSLYRIGGEEFVVVLPFIGIEDAKKVAEKIRKEVANYKFKKAGNITISIGVTEAFKGDTMDTLLKRADIGLYKSKKNGRNRTTVIYSDEDLEEEIYKKNNFITIL